MAEKEEKLHSNLPDFNLSDLMCFDETAFTSENPKEQEVCTFVLMLALVHNDFHNIAWSIHQIKLLFEKSQYPDLSTYKGQLNGMNLHCMRLLCSCIRELIGVINKNLDILETSLFKKLLNPISNENKKYWNLLVDAAKDDANNKSSNDPFLEILLKIRNNVAFHYNQPKPLMTGYKHFFMKGSYSKEFKKPYISRGNTLFKTRFYFADAAVQGYFDVLKENNKNIDIYGKILEYTDALNKALYYVVERFCQIRGKNYIQI